MPGYVMNEELKRTVQQVCLQFLNSFQPRPKRGRRRRKAGGGAPQTVATTDFGVVVDQAPPNYGPGKYVPLQAKGLKPISPDDQPLIVDPNASNYDRSRVDRVAVTFHNAHTDSTCKVLARITVSSSAAITPGQPEDPDNPVLGYMIDSSAYWTGHGSYDKNRVVAGDGTTTLMRDIPSGAAVVSGGGSGACNSSGGVDITLDVNVVGGPFLKPFPP